MNSKYLKQIKSILTREELSKLFLIVLFISFTNIFNLLSTVLILPFLNLIMVGEINNIIISDFLSFFNIFDYKTSIIFLVIIIFLFTILTTVFSIVNTYQKTNYVNLINHRVSTEILRNFMLSSYSFFTNNDSADLSKQCIDDSYHFSSSVIGSIIDISTNLSLILIFLTSLLIINFQVTSLIIVLLSLVFIFLNHLLKKQLGNAGRLQYRANKLRHKDSLELLSNIKLIKSFSSEEFFIQKFINNSNNLFQSISKSSIYSQLPKSFIELFSFSSILIFLLFVVAFNLNINHYISLLVLFTMSLYRILPGFYRAHFAYSQIILNAPLIESVKANLNQLSNQETYQNKGKNLHFNQIIFKNVGFSYDNRNHIVLNNINFIVKQKEWVGIVGKTGSGKTTFIDILLRLFQISDGDILLNTESIYNYTLYDYLSLFAYVPQETFLMNASIADNVVFGKNSKSIDFDKLNKVCKIVEIDEFIEKELPHQYQQLIGEKGLQLSGGQRQRLGIARALYRDSEIIILDEATSSLDHETEKKIMYNIRNFYSNKCLFIISHKKQALEYCDQIYTIKDACLTKI